MDRFEASALTHMLVVTDTVASAEWYQRVLDATDGHLFEISELT